MTFSPASGRFTQFVASFPVREFTAATAYDRIGSIKRLAVIGVLIALLGVPLAGCGEQETKQQSLDKALATFQAGNYQGAEIELKNLLLDNPQFAAARFLLGQVYLELGEGAAAEIALDRARSLGIPEKSLAVPFAKAYMQQKKYDRVIEQSDSAASLPEATRNELAVIRAEALILTGRAEEARAELERLLGESPDLLSAQVAMVRLDYRLGDREGAKARLEKVLATDPESIDAWSLLGNVELDSGRFAESEAAFNESISRRGRPDIDRARRAMARVRLDKVDDAKADIRDLRSSVYKQHPYVDYVDGYIRFVEQNYAEAAERFKASYDKAPKVNTAYLLAVSHYQLGNLEQARHFVDKVRGAAPNSLTANRLSGSIAMSASDIDVARNDLERVLSQSPDDPVALRMMVSAAMLGGDADASLEYAERLLKVAPDSQDAKTQLMLARLMQDDPGDFASVDKQAAEGGLGYTEDFLAASLAFKAGDNALALSRAKALHEQYPDKVDPINLMAAAHLRMNQWDEARSMLEKSLKKDPDNLVAGRNLAAIDVQQGRIDQARERLERVINAHPSDDTAVIMLVDAYDLLGKPEQATAVLEKAQVDNPDALKLRAKLAGRYIVFGDILRVLELTGELTKEQWQAEPALLETRGKAQARSGDLASARRTFEQWVEVRPETAKAHFLLGDILARTGQQSQALVSVSRAVELDAAYVAARVGEIRLLVVNGKLEEARVAIAALRSDFGDSYEVLHTEGWFAMGTNDYATAEDRLSKAIVIKQNSETMQLLARSLWLQGKQQESVNRMQDWLNKSPNDAAVMLQLGEAYLALERNDDATAVYKELLALAPNNIIALNNLAWLDRNRDLTLALEHAERAHDLAPDAPNVLDTYGQLLLKKGEQDRGLRMLQRAVDAAPNDPELKLHLGRALLQYGQPAEGARILQQLIDEHQQGAEVDQARGLLQTTR